LAAVLRPAPSLVSRHAGGERTGLDVAVVRSGIRWVASRLHPVCGRTRRSS